MPLMRDPYTVLRAIQAAGHQAHHTMLGTWLRLMLHELMNPLVILGFAGQFVFFLRFAVQWWLSEKNRRTVVPESFWYFSILGGLLTFLYAVLKNEPVFTIAQALGLAIYLRNVVIIRKRRMTLQRLKALRSARESQAEQASGRVAYGP